MILPKTSAFENVKTKKIHDVITDTGLTLCNIKLKNARPATRRTFFPDQRWCKNCDKAAVRILMQTS